MPPITGYAHGDHIVLRERLELLTRPAEQEWAEHRHRIGARIENALDEDYATSIGRGRLDLDNSSYAYRNLGAPRSLHARYTYRF